MNALIVFKMTYFLVLDALLMLSLSMVYGKMICLSENANACRDISMILINVLNVMILVLHALLQVLVNALNVLH